MEHGRQLDSQFTAGVDTDSGIYVGSRTEIPQQYTWLCSVATPMRFLNPKRLRVRRRATMAKCSMPIFVQLFFELWDLLLF
jgi:hypothetical protein